MKVFVAGASGAIGRPAVRQLVAAGHEVTGTTRSAERAGLIEENGGRAAICDALDAEALRAALAAAEPEVVVHALTALPDALNVRKPSTFEATNRLREEGTRNLVAAARAAGARRLVAESIAFIYAPGGDPIAAEEEPLVSPPGEPMKAVTDAVKALESEVLGADLEGVVLRFGYIYGPHTGLAPDRGQAEEVRRRRLPIVGKGAGLFSLVQIDDAGAAIVAAVESSAQGTFNIVDDEPASQSEWLPAYAEALGARPPRRVPLWLAKLVAGSAAGAVETMRGASNEKAKRELGWQPRHPSWRQGFREALG